MSGEDSSERIVILIIDACIVDDRLCHKHAHALLVFTDLSAIEHAEISQGVARFVSRK